MQDQNFSLLWFKCLLKLIIVSISFVSVYTITLSVSYSSDNNVFGVLALFLSGAQIIYVL